MDITQALKDGYTKQEIAEELARRRNFDIKSARNNNYTDDEIINHLQERPGSTYELTEESMMDQVGNNPEMQRKIQNTLSLSATLDTPPSEVWHNSDDLARQLKIKDASFGEKVKASFTAGWGDVYTLIGNNLKRAGFETLSKDYMVYGRRLQKAYIPPEDTSKFTWDKMIDPDWLSTTVTRSVPTWLSLLPAALVGRYVGLAGAGIAGMGAFGRAVMASIGAAGISRGVESSFEAASGYEQSLARGDSEEEADKVANEIFWDNMKLALVDVGQFVTAFTPIRIPGIAPAKTLARRIAASTGKAAAIGVTEAGEEAYQNAIERRALGEPVTWDSEMKEGAAVGFIMGAGLGTAGSVYRVLEGRMTKNMPNDIKELYNTFKESYKALGMDERDASLKALDDIAETKEGQAYIEEQVQRLKDSVEEAPQPQVSQEEQESAIEKIEEEDIEIITEEEITNIVEKDAPSDILTGPDVSIDIQDIKPIESDTVVSNITREELGNKIAEGVDVETDIQSGVGKFGKKAIEDAIGKEESKHALSVPKVERKKLAEKFRVARDIVRRAEIPEAVDERIQLRNSLIRNPQIRILMKQSIENAKKAYKAGVKDASQKAKKEIKDLLLKHKIYIEATREKYKEQKQKTKLKFKEELKATKQAAKEQLKETKKEAKEELKITKRDLKEQFRQTQQDLEQSRKVLIDYIKEELPQEARGRFLDALKGKMSQRHLGRVYGRVQSLADSLEQKERIEKLEDVRQLKGAIDIEYKQAIKDILSDINTKNISAKTLRKAKNLKKAMDNNKVSSGISDRWLNLLKKAEQKQFRELDSTEQQEIIEKVEQLKYIGKLKAKMKFKYNEKKRNAATKRLVNSTTNYDDIQNKLAHGLLYVYVETLQSPRVAEMFDGYKEYQENYKLIKRLIVKEAETGQIVRAEKLAAFDEIEKLGIENLSEDRQVAIVINIHNMEGSPDQVQTLLEEHGLDSIPELTEKEHKLIEILEKYTNKHVNQTEATYNELYYEDISRGKKEPFKRIARYILPRKYKKAFYPETPASEFILQTRHRTTKTYQAHTKQRKRGVQQIPRTDLFGIFEEAIDEQQWFLNMQPELTDIGHLIYSKEFKDNAGKFVSNWWSDHLDIIARRGWSANAKSNPFTRLLSEARGNITRAILSFKLSSMMMQIFAAVDGMGFMQGRYGTGAALNVLKRVVDSWVRPSATGIKALTEKSPALQARLRHSGELAVEELKILGKGKKQTYKKIGEAGIYPLQLFDLKTAAGIEQAVIDELKKHDVKDIQEEADMIMRLINSSVEVSYRPHVLARGEYARTFFTLQTFFLNRWGNIAHELIAKRTLKSKDMKTKLNALFGLLIYMMGGIAEDEAREVMYEFINKRDLKDISLWHKAMLAIPQNIPVVGRAVEYQIVGRGLGADIPLERVIKQAIAAFGVLSAKDAESAAKDILKTAEGVTVLMGVPGSAQIGDILTGILFPDKKGKTRGRAAQR